MTKGKVCKVNYCCKCIDPLLYFGEILMAAYETICEFYAGFEVSMIVLEKKAAPGTMTLIRFLELKDFVVTTEITDDGYLVKPTNHSYNHKWGHLYCRDPATHCPNFVEGNDVKE